MKRILMLFAFLSCYSVYSQMEPTATLYAVEDGFTSSSTPGGNFGSLGSMSITKSRSVVERSFLKFNLISIPANAVITSAILRLTPNGTENVTTPNSSELYLDVCNTSWTEAGLTHASAISNNSLFATVTASTFNSTLSKREFQVKDHVQAMIEKRLPNQGWRIRWSSETVAIATTAAYFTKENATVSNRPQLVIQYYLRSSVSAATIVHTSALTSTDGSISPTVIFGSNTTKTFRWYNAAGAQIATTQDLTGVGKGWYGLKYYGDVSGDTTYQAFLIGTECEDVSVTFDPGPNYMDDTRLVDGVEGSGNTVINYTQVNYGSSQEIKTDKWANLAPYDSRNLLRFRLWVDPNCQINTANMTLYGIEHDPNTRPNDSELLRVTSAWTEYGAAFTNTPTSTSTGKINIAGVPLGNANVTLNIASFFNIWKTNNPTNYGMLLQLQSYAGSYTRMQFNSSDVPAGGPRLRPKVEFSIKANACDISRKGTVTVVDYDQELKKTVSVNITPPSWSVSPYRYVISELPIPDPAVVLKYLNDSVFDPDIDSTSFYRGITAATSNNFGNVDYSNYYIAVFDSKGKRIFNKNMDIFPNLELVRSSNVTSSGYEITGSAASSFCELSAFVNSSVTDCSVKFNLKNTGGDQYYGFMDVSKTLAAPQDITYGYHIKNGVLKTIINGSESTTSYAVSTGKDITVSFLNDTIIFSNDSITFNKAKLNAGYTLKGGAFVNASAKTLIKLRRVIGKQFFLFQTNVINNSRACSSTNSDLSFRVMPFLGTQFGSYTYKFSNKASGLVLVINPSASNNTTYTIPNLAPGVYTLTCTQNSGATPIQIQNTIYVGLQTEWFSTHPNYNLTPNSYSVARDNLAQGTYSKAISTNILPAATSGWAWFNPVCANMTSFFVPNVLSIVDNFSNLLPNPNQHIFLNFRRTGNTAIFGLPANSTILFWGDKLPNGTNVTGAVFLPIDPFVSLQFDAAQMKIYVRSGATTFSLTQPAGNIRLKANSTFATEGFKNVHTTFPCGLNQTLSEVGHYELGRDYSAGYATAVEGKVKFTFDEEYAIAANKKLQYVVYDDTNLAIASGFLDGTVTGGATALTYNFDDNRYLLNVSSFATIGKYYHLEVTTSTGQKRYLRFLYKN